MKDYLVVGFVVPLLTLITAINKFHHLLTEVGVINFDLSIPLIDKTASSVDIGCIKKHYA